jgi:hypothetical protein
MVPDKLWRTLVADRSPDGGNPPGWYRRACLQSLKQREFTDVNGSMNVSNLHLANHITKQFLKRVRSVIWNRTFFLASLWCQNCKTSGHDFLTCKRPPISRANSNANGPRPVHLGSFTTASNDANSNKHLDQLFGLAPENTQRNDIICILAGCTVPVVLRKCSNSPYYDLIGEAYVHGKMDGEAMAGLDQAALKDKLEWFDLQ